MGDGVNIAARLEGMAKPGAICLSEDAYRQVKARLDLAVNDLGPTKLKNIAEPVRVYSLEVSVAAPLTHAPQAEFATPEPSAWLALPDKPSIAVLAFQNMSGDPEQEYFADGIVEEIITGLSRIKWLFVIARNSLHLQGQSCRRAAGRARAWCALCAGGGSSQGGEPRAHHRPVARSRKRGASLG
jgi:adenylate cyclase